MARKSQGPEEDEEAALSEAGLGMGKAASVHWETLGLPYEIGSHEVGASQGDKGRAEKLERRRGRRRVGRAGDE
jgi:hypothetical protein